MCAFVCVCEREGEFCNRHRKFLFWKKRQQTNNQFNLLTGKCGLVGGFLNNLCLLKFHLASNWMKLFQFDVKSGLTIRDAFQKLMQTFISSGLLPSKECSMAVVAALW